jgi:hypothetical protein
MTKHVVFFILALGLTACGGWTKKKCERTDFSSVGYSRGSKGKIGQSDQINSTCLKKGVAIKVSSYQEGYNNGLKTYCSDSKARRDGSDGYEPINICKSNPSYMRAYDKGLKTYCTVDRGVKDGYALSEKKVVCLSTKAYLTGHKNGVTTFCSFEKGQEDGFLGSNMNSKCVSQKGYKDGHKSGLLNFCKPENGKRLGEKGEERPKRCTKSEFRASYDQGRTLFITKKVKNLSSSLEIENRNYQNLRDELQDAQFSYQELSQRNPTPRTDERKRTLSQDIRKLKKERNEQRETVTDLESQLSDLKAELDDL